MSLRSALSASILIALSVNHSVAGDAPQIDRRFDLAQIYNRPPADIDAEDPAGASGEVARLTLRVDRLEREIRQLTGRIEELQHTVQLLDDARKAQSGSPSQGAAGAGPSGVPANPAGPSGPLGQTKRGDAFDPSRDPTATGAPRPLGTTTPSAPLSPQNQTARLSQGQPDASPPVAREVGAPLDLMQGRPASETANSSPLLPAVPAPVDAAAIAPGLQVAKDDYETALSFLHKGQYEAAEKGFLAYLAKNPKSRLAPAATFNLGESFFLRGRHREAAEKYLEVSSKFSSSAQAPDALLRLGESLVVLGAKEQACASFSEIGVKYPNAPSRTKDAAQRESKKIPC